MLRPKRKCLSAQIGSCLLLACTVSVFCVQAIAQYTYNGSKDYTPPRVDPPAPTPASTPAPTPPPTPAPTPPPPTHTLVVQPVNPFSPPVIVPTDVSHISVNQAIVLPPGLPPVSDGIMVLADNRFPNERTKDSNQILVRARESAVFERPSPHAVKLVSGTILVSVRHPSELGLINTDIADLALSADGELLVSSENGILHVLNASARGTGCKVRLHSALFDQSKKHTFAIAPGYEFVAGTNKLRRGDLRPADGIARRRCQLFDDGRIALSEFSVECLLKGSDLIANLNQKDSGAKEKRIIADLSKMAAVLNQINGTQGYSYGSASKLAQNGQIQ